MPLVPSLGALAVISSLPLLWWAFSGSRRSLAASQNLSTGLNGVTDLRQAVLAHSARERAVSPAVDVLASRARRLTPNGMLDNLDRRILLAGVPEAWPIESVLAAKLILGAGGAAVGVLGLIGSPSVFSVILAGAAALFLFFLPDILLHNAAQKRQLKIQNALPDTLDQMTISVEAGLAFEAAMARAGRSKPGPLNQELLRTMQDVQAGLSRADALRQLVARTEVDELRHFVLAVLQAESHGVPVANILRIQAGELRIKRRQRAEENAMKLPVKILFPLVLCILPTLFAVLLGPAALRISQTLGSQ